MSPTERPRFVSTLCHLTPCRNMQGMFGLVALLVHVSQPQSHTVDGPDIRRTDCFGTSFSSARFSSDNLPVQATVFFTSDDLRSSINHTCAICRAYVAVPWAIHKLRTLSADASLPTQRYAGVFPCICAACFVCIVLVAAPRLQLLHRSRH